MADLQVIFDPSLELAAIVDLDTNLGFGPICPGPNGGSLLQAFIDGMPFDVGILTPEQAREIFLSVFRDDVAASVTASAGTDSPPVESAGSAKSVDEARATAEAVAAGGEPPAPAPHDADMETNTGETVAVDIVAGPPASTNHDITAGLADTTPADTTSNCMLCNPNGTGSTNPGCIVCGGSGKVRAA